MKTILIVSMLLVMVSCSSVQKTGDTETDALLAHMAKGTVVVGKDFDEKFNKDGFVNGEFVAIGSANSADLDYMIRPLRVRAEADATARLLRSAPTEFKKIVMGAIDTANGDEGSVQESQIQITEVKALTGMKSHFDDIQCVKTASPNQNMKYNFNKECRVIVRVPASELMKAYKYTLDKKYGIQQQNDIQKMLMDEMNKGVQDAKPKSEVPVQASINQ